MDKKYIVIAEAIREAREKSIREMGDFAKQNRRVIERSFEVLVNTIEHKTKGDNTMFDSDAFRLRAGSDVRNIIAI